MRQGTAFCRIHYYDVSKNVPGISILDNNPGKFENWDGVNRFGRSAVKKNFAH